MASSPPLRPSVRVRSPATSANLGPGFDCLGLALDLYNDLVVRTDVTDTVINVEGEGADTIATDVSGVAGSHWHAGSSNNLVMQALALGFEAAGYATMPPVHVHMVNRIPIGAGLGSSAAAIVGALAAVWALTGGEGELSTKDAERVLALATRLESHVDNLAPCIFGGLQIGVRVGERWQITNVRVPTGLRCVLYVPDARKQTTACRAILPSSIPRSDAIFNIGRVAMLVNAFASGCLEDLAIATQDALHQPARSEIMPALKPCITAALGAGANAAYLSGAGSAIMALVGTGQTEAAEHAVAQAMQQAALAAGVPGRVIITNPAARGAHAVPDYPSGTLPGVAPATAALGSGSVATPLRPATSAQSICYVSTRDSDATPARFSDIVLRGMAPDGGLYVPTHVPALEPGLLATWINNASLSYADVAYDVMRAFVGDDEIPAADLSRLVRAAYRADGSSEAPWTHPAVMPLVAGPAFHSESTTFILEQFHGPTAAFKDGALQFLGRLFEYLLQRRASASGAARDGRMTVVGATSGDTGSAAIAGLRGRAGVHTFILHPAGRVAKMQELQMTSIIDPKVHNIAVADATFDDCQAMVKRVFADYDFASSHHLSAINSINWARVLAQIAYYWWAYVQWARQTKATAPADDTSTARTLPPVTFVVPTGNFGNALAGWYAKAMGLPVDKIVVATNANDILHRFVSMGDYSTRGVVATLAPSMDIQQASNLERYIYHALDNNGTSTAVEMRNAVTTGKFSSDLVGTVLPRLQAEFQSFAANDGVIEKTITDVAQSARYVCCPHTAAGLAAAANLALVGPVICLATAHPAKFAAETRSLQEIGYRSEDDVDATLSPTWPDVLRRLTRRPRRVATLVKDVDVLKDFIETCLAADSPHG